MSTWDLSWWQPRVSCCASLTWAVSGPFAEPDAPGAHWSWHSYGKWTFGWWFTTCETWPFSNICSMAMLNLPSGIWVCLKWGIPLTVDFNGENGNGPLNFGGIYIYIQTIPFWPSPRSRSQTPCTEERHTIEKIGGSIFWAVINSSWIIFINDPYPSHFVPAAAWRGWAMLHRCLRWAKCTDPESAPQTSGSCHRLWSPPGHQERWGMMDWLFGKPWLGNYAS